MMVRLGKSLLWLGPYLVSGFSAPLIFKMAATPNQGGHIAGMLFIFAGAWSLYLAISHRYSSGVKAFLILAFVSEISFWGWRFSNSVALADARLLGISGPRWHGVMTATYLICALVLFVSEVRRADVKILKDQLI